MAEDTAFGIAQRLARTAEAGVGTVYADWAGRYDLESAALGFRLPAMAAAFLARYVPADAGPILDAGVGTGLVGDCLRVLGYGDLTGLDLSPAMLEEAAKTGAYNRLETAVLGEPLPFADDSFAASLCIGVFAPDHAPPECLREIVRVTRPGGPVLLNVVEATWREQGFPTMLEALTAEGRWTLLEERAGWRPYTLGEATRLTRFFVFRVS